MSTRSYIGIRHPDSTISYIYCHHDGYPEYVGAILHKCYPDTESVQKLLELGDLSILGETLEECCAYARDRGGRINPPRKALGILDAVDGSEVEWMYVFVQDPFGFGGKWACSKVEMPGDKVIPVWTKKLSDVLEELGVFD